MKIRNRIKSSLVASATIMLEEVESEERVGQVIFKNVTYNYSSSSPVLARCPLSKADKTRKLLDAMFE